MSSKPMEVMMVAAEASSAAYAIKILQQWKIEGQDVHAFGVGSLDMEKLGFERLGNSEDMAVVGAAEIISQYSHLKAVFNKLVAEAARRRPRVVVVMDYPEFNLMLAKKMHQLNIPVVYYISPQVWAWRQGRVKTIKKYCQKVFLLFPFEKPFYEAHQVNSEFVGHPILDDLNPDYLDAKKISESRKRYGLSDQDVVLGLMPGSRWGELKQHFQIQLETARNLVKKYPQVRVVILCAPTFTKENLEPYLEDLRFPYILLKNEPFEMIKLVDIMLVASGTATLMVGLLQKPMVIMYKMKWLTAWFARIFIRGSKYFGLVNLILDRMVVQERFQEQANPEILQQDIEKFILDRAYTEKIKNELGELIHHLGDRGATGRVVRSLDQYLTPDSSQSSQMASMATDTDSKV